MVISLERNERKSAAKRRYKIQDPIGWLKTNSLNILRGFDKHTHTHTSHTSHESCIIAAARRSRGKKSREIQLAGQVGPALPAIGGARSFNAVQCKNRGFQGFFGTNNTLFAW